MSCLWFIGAGCLIAVACVTLCIGLLRGLWCAFVWLVGGRCVALLFVWIWQIVVSGYLLWVAHALRVTSFWGFALVTCFVVVVYDCGLFCLWCLGVL